MRVRVCACVCVRGGGRFLSSFFLVEVPSVTACQFLVHSTMPLPVMHIHTYTFHLNYKHLKSKGLFNFMQSFGTCYMTVYCEFSVNVRPWCHGSGQR